MPAWFSTLFGEINHRIIAVIFDMKLSKNKNLRNAMAVRMGVEPTWRYKIPNPDSSRGRYQISVDLTQGRNG